MLEIEPTGQCHANGWNSNEAIITTASEAFDRWLHHQYAIVKLPLSGQHIVLPHNTLIDLTW